METILKGALMEIMEAGGVKVSFNISEERIAEKINDVNYLMLFKIHEVLENEQLNDFQCIVEILSIFEKHKIPCKNRHDIY